MRVFLMLKGLTKKSKVENDGLYDYTKYHMKLKDRAIAFLIGFGLAAIAIHIFFGSIIVDLVVGIATGIVAQPIYRKMMIKKIRRQLLLQFRDLLDSLSSSVSAGKVINAAFADAEKDMNLQYGEDSPIYKEVRAINLGLINSANIEDLLMDFGKRSGIEDIVSFANVFSISNRRGGEIKSILGETKSILCDKIDIEMEIQASLNSTKNELNILMLMPLIVVPMMSSFSQDSDNPAINITVKIAGLAIFIIAYIIGRKITDIKV